MLPQALFQDGLQQPVLLRWAQRICTHTAACFWACPRCAPPHSSKKHREKGLLLLLLKVARQGGLITEQTLPHTICWVYCRTTFVIIQLAGVTLCKSTISAFTRRVIRLYVAILPNRTLGCIAPAIRHFVVVLQMTWSIAIVGGIRTRQAQKLLPGHIQSVGL